MVFRRAIRGGFSFLLVGEWVVFHGGRRVVVVGVSAAEAVDPYFGGHDMDEEVE